MTPNRLLHRDAATASAFLTNAHTVGGQRHTFHTEERRPVARQDATSFNQQEVHEGL